MLEYPSPHALFSQIPAARRLISLLNKHSPLHHDRTIELQPLWLCWVATGSWPDGERETARADEEIEELARQWEQSWWYRESYAADMTNEEGSRRTLAELDDPRRAHVENGAAVWAEGGLVRALQFRYRMQQEGEGNGVPSFEETLKARMGVARDQRILFQTLAQSKLMWKAVEEGAIARAMGVDEKDVMWFGRAVGETFVKRFEEGRMRPVVGSIEEMLKTIAENTGRNEQANKWMLSLGEETDEMPTLLRDPAPVKCDRFARRPTGHKAAGGS
ncbi:hypothetical protein BU16DRAFT_601026 [Lophium mytilinum]|uniref:Uncharacterized protein n=1 Tax=Lophium mytilinum TaxID=390894 RepID=A0A6A6Q8R2_9PEZI|nr:hypothetical protein BU16DRAFT_601026 [Lophium mytilinum]